MNERTAVLIRLTHLNGELADARLALLRCPANERASIAQRIREIQSEIIRGEELLAKTPILLPPTPAGEADPLATSNPVQADAAFSSTQGAKAAIGPHKPDRAGSIPAPATFRSSGYAQRETK